VEERGGGIFPCRPWIPPVHPHQYLCVCPLNWHWHKPDTGVSCTVSVCPGFYGPYNWSIVKGRLKGMAIKKLLLSNHSEWEMYWTHIHVYGLYCRFQFNTSCLAWLVWCVNWIERE
jgi:hypothetical protein